jgi:hypothetical protein
MTTKTTTPAPQLGNLVTIRGVACRIIAIRPFGTIDVEALDGSGRAWRVSGLAVGR